jgi:hypothetical protein
MSDNVINFPHRLRQLRNTDDKNDPQDHENKIRARELKRLREIERMLPDHPRFFSTKDRLRAAEALWELKENHTRRGEQNAIKRGFGDTHIHRLMSEPTPELTNRDVLTRKKLTAIIRPYLKLAKAIAEVAGKGADDFQLHVLRNTSYWQNFSHDSDQKGSAMVVDEAANEVAYLIESMCGRIVRDTNLSALFARMRRVCGQWDIRTSGFRPSSMSCLFRTAYCEGYEHWTEAPPLPSIPLARLWHAGLSFPARVSDQDCTEHLATAALPEEIEAQPVELHIFRELRLALGPTINAETLGPMFESRPYAELRILDRAGKELSRGPLDFDSNWNLPDLNPDCSATLFLNDRWHSFTPLAVLGSSQSFEEDVAQTSASLSGLHVEAPFLWDFTPLSEKKNCFENWYISWTPVDSAHVAHWLDRIEHQPPSHPVEFLPEVPNRRPARNAWYPRPYLGNLVEASIGDGRLDAALRAEVERVRTSFEAHEIEWTARMQEQTAVQIVEFNSDLVAAAIPQIQPTDKNDDQDT